MLKQVTPPQPSLGVYTYFYEDSVDPKRLTGYAVDGVRRTRYTYDASGKVIRSATEDGEIADTFTYSASSTVKRDVRGHATTYNFSTVSGQRLLSSTQTTGTISCPSAVTFQSYDANGYLAQTVDFNGNKTTYTFDLDGILQSKTVAHGSSSALPRSSTSTAGETSCA
jgi:YD repeat-containing protein